MNSKTKIKEAVLNLILESSAQAVLKFLKSKRLIQKIIWFIFLVLSTSLCGWFSFKCFLNYSKFEVFTLVETIYEQPTQFPTITFTTADRSKPLANKSLRSIIIECWFNYDKECEKNPDNYFEYFYSSNMGPSYRFNSGRNMSGHMIDILNATIGGRDDSFRLKINSGLTIWIHNSSSIPNPEFYNNHAGDMHFASPGFQTQFILEKVVETKLDEPYNRCLNDVSMFDRNKTLINFILGKNQTYNQRNCLELCFDLEYIEFNPCQCTASIGDVWENCWIKKENKNFTSCTIKYKERFYKQDLLSRCENYCPLECSSVTNLVSIDNVPYYNQSVAYVVIYYRTLRYTAITQEPKLYLTDLVSSVGGTFSLFIGLTLVNLIEAFEIFFEILFIFFERLFKKLTKRI